MLSRPTPPPQRFARLRRWMRRGLIAAGLLVLAPLLYVAAGFGLAWVPVNTAFHPDHRGVQIAVLHNGVHADLVLPLQTAQVDWWDLLSPDDFVQDTTAFGYAAFGWGNRVLRGRGPLSPVPYVQRLDRRHAAGRRRSRRVVDAVRPERVPSVAGRCRTGCGPRRPALE